MRISRSAAKPCSSAKAASCRNRPVSATAALDESYTLRFVVDLRQEGDSEQEAEARAWELAAAGITTVWNNPTFASERHRVTRVESSQVNQPLPGWWRTQIIVDVRLVASAVSP